MNKEELEKEAEEYRESKRHKSFRADVGTVQINYESYLNNLQQAYLAGAEPREKRIEELTEHNETLMLQIQSLGKENAELKEQCSILADCNTCVSDCKTENIEIKKQLTKAKELLERLLITSCSSDVLNLLPNCSEVLRVRVEAEQFLNSEVEK